VEDEHLLQIKSTFLAMKKLKHPNIIRYEALYVDMKKHAGWLVMELVEKPTLDKVQIKSEEEIRRIMQQILDALSYLHKHGIIHRDIKLENVLYNKDEKSIKIIDFGISRKFKQRGSFIDMWTITGTLYYRAPEMFAGGYREGVDVWAAGILLYKLVSGKTPFESEYHNETIKNITRAKFEFPSEFDNFSPELRSLVTKMLNPKADERADANECLRHEWFNNLPSPLIQRRRKFIMSENVSIVLKIVASQSPQKENKIKRRKCSEKSVVMITPKINRDLHYVDSEFEEEESEDV